MNNSTTAMSSIRKLASAALTGAALAASAFGAQAATTTLYESNAIDGNWGAYTIYEGQNISQSFTLTKASTVTGVVAGLWSYDGLPSTVSWAFGTDFFGTSLGAGTSAVNNTLHNQAYGFYDVTESTFAVDAMILDAGTYYLTLTAAGPNYVFWDASPTSEEGAARAGLQNIDASAIYSVSFRIQGQDADAAVPEPGALALVSTALLALALTRQAKRRQA